MNGFLHANVTKTFLLQQCNSFEFIIEENVHTVYDSNWVQKDVFDARRHFYGNDEWAFDAMNLMQIMSIWFNWQKISINYKDQSRMKEHMNQWKSIWYEKEFDLMEKISI